MRLDSAFRLSAYLTLGMACACLGYAAQPFLPEVIYLGVPVAILLLIAYFVEGRWTMTDVVANLVATPIIAACIGVWAAYRLAEPPQGPAEGMVFLVLMGSFLTILMLAKLFRPKRDRDFWFLHFTAFIAVAISCALDADVFFGLLLMGYLACGVWSIALFHLATNQPRLTPGALDNPVPWRALGIWQASGRALVVASGALFLFLLTPRLGVTRWDGSLLSLPSLQTLAVDPGMDLNRTGTVRLSKAVVFEVVAEDAHGNPKLDLSPNMHWRGAALNTYARGRCFNRLPLIDPPAEKTEEPSGPKADDPLPDLGPDQYFLTVVFASRPVHRVWLAEPIRFTPPDGRLPVQFHDSEGQPAPLARNLNTEVPPPFLTRQKCSYRQVLAPPSEPGLIPAVDVEKLLKGALSKPPDVPGLREWTIQLLFQLVENGTLRRSDIEADSHGNLLPEHHEKVARALEAHLARSGEYTYTLKLARQDATIDPTLDFLRNIKEGHCQRFAAGLVVMLRSVGVPARIVVGYLGAQPMGNGTYQVRQCDAHSWAEVLIRRPTSSAKPEWYWLTLDPTPGTGSDADLSLAGWWRVFRNGGGDFWRSFVIDYNAEQQEAAMLELWQFFQSNRAGAAVRFGRSRYVSLTLLALGALVVLGGFLLFRLGWRLRATRRTLSPQFSIPRDAAFYAQMLAILARRCRLNPDASQTPREFAQTVHRKILQVAGESLADIPLQLTRLYYRVRFAGLPLTAAEADEVQRRIAELDAGLQTRGRAVVENPQPAG